MYGMFYGCNSLNSIDLTNFDVSSVTNLDYIFYNCNSLISINYSNLNLSNANTMNYIFYNFH